MRNGSELNLWLKVQKLEAVPFAVKEDVQEGVRDNSQAIGDNEEFKVWRLRRNISNDMVVDVDLATKCQMCQALMD